MSWDVIFEHLFIVLAASILSIAVGLPLGIWAYVSRRARPVILRIVDLLQTIPSLALLGIIMVVLDPGKLTVITGITLYSLLPIVRNTCLGLQEVDPGVKEAARGMGMSKPYRVLMVEFPLAFPTVFTGIRIAVVNAIGTAVFAAFVGGGGLGGVITQAIRISDMSLILAATGVLMVIAVVRLVEDARGRQLLFLPPDGGRACALPRKCGSRWRPSYWRSSCCCPMAAAAPATFFSMTATTPKPS